MLSSAYGRQTAAVSGRGVRRAVGVSCFLQCWSHPKRRPDARQ